MNYRTSDFGTVIYLAYCGFDYSVDKFTDPRRTWFTFIGDGIEQEVEKYQNHEARIEPLKYFSVQREIKSRLYD